MSVTVKWNKKKYNINFDTENIDKGPWTDNYTLLDLKKKCFEQTGVPIGRQKLLFSGATMKDDNATLSKYGIKHGSNILLLGKAEPKIAKPEQAQREGEYYPMPKPKQNHGPNHQNHQNHQKHQNHPQGYYPPQQPGYGYNYPPPQQPGYGYGYYPQQGYPLQPGYPPQQDFGYGYPPQQFGYNYPPPPDAAFLSSPTQNPAQTIRVPNGGEYGQGQYYQPPPPGYENPYYPEQGFYPPPNAPNDNFDASPNAPSPNAPPANGPPPAFGKKYPNANSTTTSGTNSPVPGKLPTSKEERQKQAKEQPLLFLENCLAETTNEIEPLVNSYVDKVNRHPRGQPMTDDLEKSYKVASELLMQKLLLVDQVMAGQNEEIRAKRKAAVKMIQRLIDIVDDKKNELKQKISNK